ncbi:hypothetical protein [Oribacterium sp.]
MITAETIKSVNERVKKIEVKGKNYTCVAARISAFRELCPVGTISTEILSLADGVVTMKTTITDENGKILATGMAQEKETSSYINKTSYIENCETSAVGRALGMLGIGSDEQMASAEEVANAINNQNKQANSQSQQNQTPAKTKEEVEAEKAKIQKEKEEAAKKELEAIDNDKIIQLKKMFFAYKFAEDNLLAYYHLEKLEQMTNAQYTDFSKKWKVLVKQWGGITEIKKGA